MNMLRSGFAFALSCFLLCSDIFAAEKFRVACFNLNNYLSEPSGNRPLKSPKSKAKVRESLRALDAHVLAVEEMGSINALTEFRESLKGEGMDYPHWEYVWGADTNIHLAVL